MDRATPAISREAISAQLTTERAAALLVLGALLFLVAVKHGFRGVSVPGA